MPDIIEIPEMLKQREKQYGSFVSHSNISQELQDILRDDPAKWDELRNIQKEALTMICHKIARILNGDPMYLDNWADICGYSQLVVNYLNESKKTSISDL